MDEQDRAVPVRDLEQRAHLLGVLRVRKAVARQLRADDARQRQRALELGGGGGNIRERQRGIARLKRPSCFWQIFDRLSLTRRHSGSDTSSGCDSIQQHVPSSDSTLVLTPWRSILAR